MALQISKNLQVILNTAFQRAVKARHEYLTPEHLLAVMLNDAVIRKILMDCEVDVQLVVTHCEEFLQARIPASDGEEPLNSGLFQRIMERAILHAEHVGVSSVSAKDVLVSLFDEKKSSAAHFLQHAGLTRLNLLRYIAHGEDNGLDSIIVDEIENEDVLKADDTHEQSTEDDWEDDAAPYSTKRDKYTEVLDEFTTNLTALAAENKLDPLIGREDVLERTILVLGRRKKNNPIYVGDPGVGKTALAEGLASRIITNNTPSFLQDFQLYSLDMNGVVSGTRFRGDFEKRIKMIITALEKKKNVILFIDEIHTIVGAGAGSGGGLDASNALKPLLAAGEVRCVGATTHEEYRRYFEKDRALTRRFQKIDIPELNVEESIKVLHGLRGYYEAHHKVHYAEGVLEAAARLSSQYITDRFLPDKAIDVIDECGVVARMRHERSQKKQKKKQTANDKTKIQKGTKVQEDRKRTPEEADELPQVFEVDEAIVEDVVSRMAQIPKKRITKNERTQLQNLADRLSAVVFGQDAAVASVANAIKRSRAGFRATHKPVASFLFIGSTGVGKTELAKQLAQTMDIALIRFDMSEYQERHAVSRLIGSPPGYVGYDEGAQLTDAVRKTPYAVLLLDEIEKAHPDIQHILLQIMDYATLSDNSGRKADFRNIVLIMTSNAGAREIGTNVVGFDSHQRGIDASHSAIERIFSPEFRGRIDRVVFFNGLSNENVAAIVKREVAHINVQLADKNITLKITKRCVKWLATKSMAHDAGARGVERMMEECIRSWFVDKVLFEDNHDTGLVVTADYDGHNIFFKQKPTHAKHTIE